MIHKWIGKDVERIDRGVARYYPGLLLEKWSKTTKTLRKPLSHPRFQNTSVERYYASAHCVCWLTQILLRYNNTGIDTHWLFIVLFPSLALDNCTHSSLPIRFIVSCAERPTLTTIPLHCLETSGTNRPVTRHGIAGERRPRSMLMFTLGVSSLFWQRATTHIVGSFAGHWFKKSEVVCLTT